MALNNNFTIVVNLSNYFHDHRHRARLYINSNVQTVQDVIQKIRDIFQIKDFALINDNEYLPPSEDVRIIKNNDIIWAVPIPDEQVNVLVFKKKKSKNKQGPLLPSSDIRIAEVDKNGITKSKKKRKQEPNNLEMEEFKKQSKKKPRQIQSEEKLVKLNTSHSNGTNISIGNCLPERVSYTKSITVPMNTEQYLKEKKINIIKIDTIYSPYKIFENEGMHKEGSTPDEGINENMDNEKIKFNKMGDLVSCGINNINPVDISLSSNVGDTDLPEFSQHENIQSSLLTEKSKYNNSQTSLDKKVNSEIEDNENLLGNAFKIKYDLHEKVGVNTFNYSRDGMRSSSANILNKQFDDVWSLAEVRSKNQSINAEKVESEDSEELICNKTSDSIQMDTSVPLHLKNTGLQVSYNNKPSESEISNNEIKCSLDNPHKNETNDIEEDVQSIHLEFMPDSDLSLNKSHLSDNSMISFSSNTSIAQADSGSLRQIRSKKHSMGVGQILDSIRNSDIQPETISMELKTSTEDYSAFPNVTQRRRHRVRKRKSKSKSSSNTLPIPAVVASPKPLNVVAQPKIHMKFEDDHEESLKNNCESINASEDNCEESSVCIKDRVPKIHLLESKKSILIPKVGNIIEFKILKISASFTPEMSMPIIGEVKDILSESNLVLFDILCGIEEFATPEGKLSMNTDEDHTSSKSTLKLYKWLDIYEPRLL